MEYARQRARVLQNAFCLCWLGYLQQRDLPHPRWNFPHHSPPQIGSLAWALDGLHDDRDGVRAPRGSIQGSIKAGPSF